MSNETLWNNMYEVSCPLDKGEALRKVIAMYLRSGRTTWHKHPFNVSIVQGMVTVLRSPTQEHLCSIGWDGWARKVTLHLEARGIPVNDDVVYSSRKFPNGCLQYSPAQVPLLSPMYCGVNYGEPNTQLIQLLDREGYLFFAEKPNKLVIWDHHDNWSCPGLGHEFPDKLRKLLRDNLVSNPIMEEESLLTLDIDPGYQTPYSRWSLGYSIK